ncbi:leucine-rich repeat neuronal protein 4 [Carassius gibelio]|uniref:leucine-rich repeat neuronal protein 4 n=1 Tax=Carassius gibelio TaxID=101364 RepID=UPI0022789F8B|nr:leucine-rich repeat neuronal protein 4 [Carassius gibelio]XP_052448559.1 leucine-rich repeat neuronal protein 4 [Carassius gibelio]XP_052448560.1 leucine-rich repeat neuronal protein 4 [Carassius gibelio]
MLGCGCPVILLLLIKFLDLSFVSSASSSSSSSSQNATLLRLSALTDDNYEDYTTEPQGPSTTNSEGPNNNCKYDLCVEHQQTCQELARVTGCRCPGLSSAFTPPSPPYLLDLIQQDGKGVVVRWCAPTSIVTHYIVRVKGSGKVEKVGESKRRAVLDNVEAGAYVCVEAVNKSGVSAKDEKSCAVFQPQNSDSGLALKLGIIGGVVGLILLLILALLLWRHKTRQISTARTETEGVL